MFLLVLYHFTISLEVLIIPLYPILEIGGDRKLIAFLFIEGVIKSLTEGTFLGRLMVLLRFFEDIGPFSLRANARFFNKCPKSRIYLSLAGHSCVSPIAPLCHCLYEVLESSFCIYSLLLFESVSIAYE